MQNIDDEDFFIETEETLADRLVTLIFFVVLFGSIFFAFYRFVIAKDYIVEAQANCDPTTEKCFVWKCDPESSVEGEACTGDEAKDIWYYKIVRKNASRVALCNPDTDDTCEPMICAPGEKDCVETLCNDQNKVEQKVECNDPEQYLKDNPPTEEDATDVDSSDGSDNVDNPDDSTDSSSGAAADNVDSPSGTDNTDATATDATK